MIAVAAMAAQMVSTWRACSVLPRRVCSVDTSRAGFSSRPRPTFCEYGPCSSKAASVEPISPDQLAMTSPGTPLRRAPEGQQTMRKAIAPASSVKNAYSSQRAIAYKVATVAASGDLIAGTWVALGAPTENVNAPCTSWESADTTCHSAV